MECDLSCKFVDGIDERLGAGGYDVGIGRESVVGYTVMFDCHVDFTYIIAALVDGLNEEFFDEHVAVDDVLDSGDGCVDGTVARGACFKFLTGDVESYACH